MVSTNKTPKYGTRDGGRGIRSWRYQDVAIMVRGSDQRAVKEYANSLAEVLGVYAEIEGKGRYIIPLYRFLVGDGIVDREAEQKVRAALAPKITAKTTSGRKERRLKFPPEKKVDTGRLPWLR
ncbi:hypothetical protein HYX00_00290 [Candidatus Woesearchaeota archaeon]|nr:hypothetical protein [Candidatus Woesearchaeota archaeon]